MVLGTIITPDDYISGIISLILVGLRFTKIQVLVIIYEQEKVMQPKNICSSILESRFVCVILIPSRNSSDRVKV